MVSKIARIREAMRTAQDLTKAQILFVAVPVLNEEDHKSLKMLQASRVFRMYQGSRTQGSGANEADDSSKETLKVPTG